MTTVYSCENERRLQRVDAHATLNGIAYLEVVDGDLYLDFVGTPPPSEDLRQRTLLVHMVKPLVGSLGAVNVRIEAPPRAAPVQVAWARRAADAADLRAEGLISSRERDFLLALSEPEAVLVVRTTATGDFSTYTLRLVTSVTDDGPPDPFDVRLAALRFSFKVACPSEFDCATEPACPPSDLTTPHIDYLAKDYASFRRLLLDRLSVVMPGWTDRSAADLQIALVELLAYVGDHLSYAQDAVGTEAYLGTARRRVSLRRHARLLDYAVHEGCNARAWVHVTVGSAAPSVLPARTVLRTRGEDGLVFETMHDLDLHAAHNWIEFYTWGDEACCLAAGATRATLLSREDPTTGVPLALAPGDVLVFEETISPTTGLAADADPAHRHAVRLIDVGADDGRAHRSRGRRRRRGTRATRCPSRSASRRVSSPAARSTWSRRASRAATSCSPTRARRSRRRRRAARTGGCAAWGGTGRGCRTPSSRLPNRIATRQRCSEPAAAALVQDPRAALPLGTSGSTATARRGRRSATCSAAAGSRPSSSSRSSDDGRATLRFGDGVQGDGAVGGHARSRRPTASATGRRGTSAPGRSRTPSASTGVEAVARTRCRRRAGRRPRACEQVRAVRAAGVPHAAARRHRGRLRRRRRAACGRAEAAATLPLDRQLDDGLRHRRPHGRPPRRRRVRDGDPRATSTATGMAGYDLEIDDARVRPARNRARRLRRARLLPQRREARRCSTCSASRDLPDGRRGFFHPDRFTFGQPVYLSHSSPPRRPSTAWPSRERPTVPALQRAAPTASSTAGVLALGRLEIARLDNDPSFPERRRRSRWTLAGGL